MEAAAANQDLWETNVIAVCQVIMISQKDVYVSTLSFIIIFNHMINDYMLA